MVRIKVMKLSRIIYSIVVFILIAAILILLYRLIFYRRVPDGGPVWTENETDESEDVSPVLKNILSEGLPAVSSGGGNSGILLGIFGLFRSWDFRDPRTLMHNQMPYLTFIEPEPPPEAIEVAGNIAIPNRSSVERPDAGPLEAADEGDEDGAGNLPEEIKILIDQIVDDMEPIELTGSGPQILIYSTHSREAYRQDPKDPYKEAYAEAFRSDDLSHTVINVAGVLARQLEKRGIPVLHDPTEHEQNDYNSSYERSLQTIKKQQAAHDSLKVFIDIHRNGYDKGETKDPDEEVVVINGKRVAKVFMVIGTGEGVMGGFSEKPNWQENAKFALKLTNKVNELYPGLAKDVIYKTGRYNQHISTRAILIEVGSSFTTMEEAIRATEFLAEAISQIME